MNFEAFSVFDGSTWGPRQVGPLLDEILATCLSVPLYRTSVSAAAAARWTGWGAAGEGKTMAGPGRVTLPSAMPVPMSVAN